MTWQNYREVNQICTMLVFFARHKHTFNKHLCNSDLYLSSKHKHILYWQWNINWGHINWQNGGLQVQAVLYSNWYVANTYNLATRVLCLVMNSTSSCFKCASTSSDRIILTEVFSVVEFYVDLMLTFWLRPNTKRCFMNN